MPKRPQPDLMPGPVYVDPNWTWDDITRYIPASPVRFSACCPAWSHLRRAPGEEYPRSFIFRQFMTASLMDLIAETSNRYDKYRKACKVQHPRSVYFNYVDVTRDELYVFLALVILMGVVKKPTIHSYWSTDPLIATTGFNRIKSREKFQAF